MAEEKRKNNPSKKKKRKQPSVKSIGQESKKSQRSAKNRGSQLTEKRKKNVQKRKKQPKQPQINKLKIILRRVVWVSEHILFFLFIGFCIWLFFNFNSHRVKGVSMAPTLTEGDRSFVVIRGYAPVHCMF